MSERFEYYYLGFVIVLASMLGGTVHHFLWTDHLIQIALLPAVIMGFSGLMGARITAPVRWLALASVGLVLLQFLPLGAIWTGDPAGPATDRPHFSPFPGKSLESGLTFLALMGFGLRVAQLEPRIQRHLLSFIFWGVVFNLVLVLVQLSYAQRFGLIEFLPYPISVGIFANENHLSTYLLLAIPVFTYKYLIEENSYLIYLPVVLIVVVALFAVGSRAGMALAIALALFSIFWFKSPAAARQKLLWLSPLVVLALGYAWFAGLVDIYFQDERWQMAQNSWRAVQSYWLLGTGLGTFESTYQLYEPAEQIGFTYTHHAHNDYLELIFETGLLGVALVAGLVALIAAKAGNTQFSQACTLSIITVLLHSLLDYPLRTMAVGLLFSYFVAVVLSSQQSDESVGSRFRGRARKKRRTSKRRRGASVEPGSEQTAHQ